MIGWLTHEVRAHLLDPQTGSGVPADRRCHVDPPESSVPTVDRALEVTASTTRPIRQTIGGGPVTLLHTIRVDLTVLDGDRERGVDLRDAIVADVIDRLLLDPTLDGAASADGRQALDRLDWAVDYSPTVAGVLASFAALTFTAEVDLTP